MDGVRRAGWSVVPADAADAGASVGPDEALVAGLRRGDQAAASTLFVRFAPFVRALLLRILGPTPEVADLIHDTFVQALESIHSLREAGALKAWIATTTVHVARGHLRQKRRRAWLVFRPSEEVPEVPTCPADDDAAVLAATHAVLQKLGEDERIVFTLRRLEELPLVEVAAVAGVSLATAKRWLARAEERFERLCEADPVLRVFLRGGGA